MYSKYTCKQILPERYSLLRKIVGPMSLKGETSVTYNHWKRKIELDKFVFWTGETLQGARTAEYL